MEEPPRSHVDAGPGPLGRHLTSIDLFALLLCGLFFSAWTYRTCETITVEEALLLFSLAPVTCLWGRLDLAILGLPRFVERSFLLTFLVGNVHVAFWIALLRSTTPIDVGTGYVVHAAAGPLLYGFLRGRIGSWSIAPAAERTELAALFVALAAATLWIQHLFPQTFEADGAVVLRCFNEYYSNAVNYLPLLDVQNPNKVGSFHYFGEPLSFYHWAGYVHPALLHQFGRQSANDALSSIWYPMGIVMTGVSAFVLGKLLFGRRGGYWAVLGTVVLPDPTYWSFPILLYSPLALLEASSGMAYALAAAALSVWLVIVGARNRHAPSIAAGLSLAFASAFFKVNIIIPSLPAALWALLTFSPNWRERRTLVFAAVYLAVVGGAYLAGSRLRSAPTFEPDPGMGAEMVAYVAPFTPPGSALAGLLPYCEPSSGPLWLPARAVYVALASFQLGVVLWLVVWLASIAARRRVTATHALPLFSLLFYVATCLFLSPNRNGDPFELQHRNFIWYWFLLMTWAYGEAGRWIGVSRLRNALRAGRRSWGYTASLLLLAFPLMLGRTSPINDPDLVMPAGLLRSIEWIRQHARWDEAYVDLQNDPWLILTGLIERRGYVCRDQSYNFPGSGALRQVRLDRWGGVARLKSADTIEKLREWARSSKVRYCLVHPEDRLRWPAEFLARPAFQSGDYRVYDLRDLDPIEPSAKGGDAPE